MRKTRVPGDKSIPQRALIVASLATGESRLSGLLPSADPQATAAVLRALGVPIATLPGDGSELRVAGLGLQGLRDPGHPLDFQKSVAVRSKLLARRKQNLLKKAAKRSKSLKSQKPLKSDRDVVFRHRTTPCTKGA